MVSQQAMTDSASVSSASSGDSGGSYGALTPVNCGISPARAFLYRPFGSRRSHTSTSTSRKTSMKLPAAARLRDSSRSERYGEMKEVMMMSPASRSEEYTSELQSRETLVCRLL